nr:CBM_HP1_G0009520.mRNA.1.CDS.1 [Saccharomyces cerevisiae]
MNIDCLCRWVVLPLLRYPLLVALVLRWYLSKRLDKHLSNNLYTTDKCIPPLLIPCTKRSGQVAWKSLREFKNGIVLITGGSKGPWTGHTISTPTRLQQPDHLESRHLPIIMRNTRVKDLHLRPE